MNCLLSTFSRNILLVLFLVTSSVFAQYEKVDQRVRTYPKTFTDSRQLAEKITADFTEPDEKIRALFTWIALNINYDLKEYSANQQVAFSYTTPADKIQKEKQFRTALVNKTLKSGKAICEGYASLFTEVCSLMNMDAVIIPGTSRNHHSQIGKLPNVGDHAWNAVKIDGEWKLLDVTWAAGIVDDKGFVKQFNDAYFFPAPEKFFLNHFPDDKKWLLTNKSAQEFAQQAFYYPTYLKSNYKLNINAGVIRIKGDVPVEFSIENLRSTDRVYYITSRDNVLDQLQVDQNNTFKIYPSSKLSGYLTIFVNEKPLVSYKIARS